MPFPLHTNVIAQRHGWDTPRQTLTLIFLCSTANVGGKLTMLTSQTSTCFLRGKPQVKHMYPFFNATHTCRCVGTTNPSPSHSPWESNTIHVRRKLPVLPCVSRFTFVVPVWLKRAEIQYSWMQFYCHPSNFTWSIKHPEYESGQI